MRIAILSAGPSLAQWPHSTFNAYDLRIAVNSAAAFIACDWWSVADAVGVRELLCLGEPLIYTRQIRAGLPGRCNGWPEDRRPRVRTWEDVGCDHNLWPRTLWGTISVTAALHLAVRLRAKTVDAYGCDRAGITDWNGRMGLDDKPVLGRALHNRTPERWDRERKKWDACCRIAEEHHGVVVNRLMPEAVDASSQTA